MPQPGPAGSTGSRRSGFRREVQRHAGRGEAGGQHSGQRGGLRCVRTVCGKRCAEADLQRQGEFSCPHGDVPCEHPVYAARGPHRQHGLQLRLAAGSVPDRIRSQQELCAELLPRPLAGAEAPGNPRDVCMPRLDQDRVPGGRAPRRLREIRGYLVRTAAGGGAGHKGPEEGETGLHPRPSGTQTGPAGEVPSGQACDEHLVQTAGDRIKRSNRSKRMSRLRLGPVFFDYKVRRNKRQNDQIHEENLYSLTVFPVKTCFFSINAL